MLLVEGGPTLLVSIQNIMPSLQFRNRAPSSASAAEAMMKQRMAHKVKKAPLSLMGLPSFAFQPMKKCPHALLCAPVSDKYDASKCTSMIMSDAQYQTVGLGFAAKWSRSCLAFFIVLVVPFVCSMAIELRVMRTVMSTAQA